MKSKDFYNGKWHVFIPVPAAARADEIGGIDMAGVDAEHTRIMKHGNTFERVLCVEVDNEEIYREYMRSEWREWQYNVRAKRCLIANSKGKIMRCPDNRMCEGCRNANPWYTRNVALEQLDCDSSINAPAEADLDPAVIHEHNSLLAEFDKYLDTLSPEDRIIANAIVIKRPDKDVMRDLDYAKQTTYSYHKKLVKHLLQQHFAEWL